MKKGFILIASASVLICSAAVLAQPPGWLWAKRIGGTSTSHDSGGSITTDAAGNTYTAGYFGGTVDFDPGAGVYNMTSTNPNDNFILKLDPSGNFIWSKKLSTFNFDNVHCIVVDASGNVYTIGYFNGTVDFDPGAGVFNMTAAGAYDVYIWKLSSAGNFIWAKAMGGTGMDEGHTIALDGSGNIYAAGIFTGTADFDPGVGAFNLTSVGTVDAFILKLDNAGNLIWAKAFGGVNQAYSYAITISPAASADIYVTGSFTGTSDFDPGAGVFNLTTNGNNDVYVCKFDNSGNFIWANAFGSNLGNDMGFSIATDPTGSGAVYVKGRMDGTVDFDPGAGVFNISGVGGFISKLSAAGNFIWAIYLGGTAGQGRSLVIDPGGNLYASGAFTGTTDFDPGPGTFVLSSSGSGDVFISKFNSGGNFVWVKTAGGQSIDVGIALALNASGSVLYMTGCFNSASASFSPFILANSGSTVYSDLFVTRLDLPSSPLPIELLAFDAELNAKGTVELHWATASEINNDYFTIEKSKDAILFDVVSVIDGAGNSSIQKEYASIDNKPFPGVNYYRLKQTDFDGQFSYSEIKAVNLENENVSDIAIYPNPASGFVTIAFNLSQAGEITFEIFDMTGKSVTTIVHSTFEEGGNEVTWDASAENPGIYFLNMNAGSPTTIKRITVAR